MRDYIYSEQQTLFGQRGGCRVGSDKFYIKEGLFAKRVAISKILQGGLDLDIFP
jgi:hypothetical protein